MDDSRIPGRHIMYIGESLWTRGTVQAAVAIGAPDERILQGRVRGRRCRRSLPSEPDVKVSLHPAQAVTKPRVSGAGELTVYNPASGR